MGQALGRLHREANASPQRKSRIQNNWDGIFWSAQHRPNSAPIEVPGETGLPSPVIVPGGGGGGGGS